MNNLRDALNEFAALCHRRSVEAGWYAHGQRNVGEMLALVHSEVSECLEGYRKNLMDDHLPHRRMAEVEIADALIRLGDLAGYLAELAREPLDIGGATAEKLEYNLHRADHKLEARKGENGKRF